MQMSLLQVHDLRRTVFTVFNGFSYKLISLLSCVLCAVDWLLVKTASCSRCAMVAEQHLLDNITVAVCFTLTSDALR